MVYSSYVLLVHVGFIDSHVHNLFLQIAVEQGLPGLAAFLGLLGVVIWRLVGLYRRREPGGALRLAPTAALVALLVQGIGEAGNYTSRMVLIGFLPFGFALGLAPSREIRDQESASLAFMHRTRWASAIWRLAVILALAGLLLPDVQAAFQANLGAVAQTRAELSVYRWPEWPIQDAVRRSPDVSLAPAIAHYQAALALAPANAAANRRLGQIELSLGQYQAARRHLEAAYAAAPGQRAVRQLLGESYAIEGEIERAVALWRTVDVSQGQLALRQWWYDHVGEPQRGAWMAEAAARSATQ
jgi:tetratricopeptide (TPR) repeat protein